MCGELWLALLRLGQTNLHPSWLLHHNCAQVKAVVTTGKVFLPASQAAPEFEDVGSQRMMLVPV